jgi:hypothetical protein
MSSEPIIGVGSIAHILKTAFKNVYDDAQKIEDALFAKEEQKRIEKEAAIKAQEEAAAAAELEAAEKAKADAKKGKKVDPKGAAGRRGSATKPVVVEEEPVVVVAGTN